MGRYRNGLLLSVGWVVALFLLFGCGDTKSKNNSGDDAGAVDSGGQALSDVRIMWQIGAGTRACADFGIRDARLILTSEADQELDRQTLGCDLGEWTFKRLEPGHYSVRVEGIDEEGVVTYQGENTDVAVPGDDHFLVDLSIIYGEAELLWIFDSGYQCQAAGVDRVHVVFEDTNQSFPVDQVFTCADGLAHLGQIPPGPYRVDVAGLNASDEIRYTGTVENQTVRPGERTTQVQITLAPAN